MKGVNYLIGKPHKAINIEYGFAQVTVQQTDGRTE
jgi:hypothetical protein